MRKGIFCITCVIITVVDFGLAIHYSCLHRWELAASLWLFFLFAAIITGFSGVRWWNEVS